LRSARANAAHSFTSLGFASLRASRRALRPRCAVLRSLGSFAVDMGMGGAFGLRMDRWHFTGNGRRPVEISGTAVPFMENDQALLKSDLEFSFRIHCEQLLAAGVMLCGATVSPRDRDETLTHTIVGISGTPACPTEVVEPFIGSGVGTTMTWNASRSMGMDGGTPLKCVKTRRYNGMWLCGAEMTNVQADDCTWDVSTLGWMGGNDRIMGLWIGAVAREGCALAMPYCNTDVLATYTP
jgi:hypothetical protein